MMKGWLLLVTFLWLGFCLVTFTEFSQLRFITTLFVFILCCVATWVTLLLGRLERAVTRLAAGSWETRMSPGPETIGRLARAFNRMADSVQSTLTAYQYLCADISHELRSPVTRLLLAVPSARRGSVQALERVEKEAARIKDLLDELMDVTRAEVDPAMMVREHIDMQDLLGEIVERCSIEAGARSCDLELRCSNSGSVLGDPDLLGRAIENVLRNAVQHSDPGSKINLIGTSDAEFTTVIVRDFGPGLPESALQVIFRPFYRVKSGFAVDESGVGLGLSIARRAVEIHGGTISAKNAHPGLRIEIQLPINPKS
jgi:signal transduction histidine kinase